MKKQWANGSYTSGAFNVRDRVDGKMLRVGLRDIPVDVVDEATGKVLDRARLMEIYSRPYSREFTPRVNDIDEMRSLLGYLFGASREDWWGMRFELVPAPASA